jgi:hypothetical protein
MYSCRTINIDIYIILHIHQFILARHFHHDRWVEILTLTKNLKYIWSLIGIIICTSHYFLPPSQNKMLMPFFNSFFYQPFILHSYRYHSSIHEYNSFIISFLDFDKRQYVSSKLNFH